MGTGSSSSTWTAKRSWSDLVSVTPLIALRVEITATAAVAAGRAPASGDVALLNRVITEAMARSRIGYGKGGFGWEWAKHERVLDWMLWPVAGSAAELLTSDFLSRLRQWADDRGCGWLFLDTSRNRSRKWCSMTSCGNRAKARRHYERARASS